MYAVMIVLDDAAKLEQVLDVWRQAGIHSATLFETAGTFRYLDRPLGMRFMLGAATSTPVQKEQFTILLVVPDLAAVQNIQEMVESVVGDLDEPNTGVLLAWAITYHKGIQA